MSVLYELIKEIAEYACIGLGAFLVLHSLGWAFNKIGNIFIFKWLHRISSGLITPKSICLYILTFFIVYIVMGIVMPR